MRFLECLKSAGKVLHRNSYLCHDEEVISLSHAKVYVFSDSVLCLGKMNLNPISNTVWERQLEWFKDSSQYRTLDTGFSTLELLREVQKFMSNMGEPVQIQGRIIFMSMLNDIIWVNKDNETECIANSTLVSLYSQKDFQQDVGHSSDLCQKQSGTPLTKKPGGKWDRVAELMMIKFGESGHPVFRASSPLSRGTLERKGGGKLFVHFCAAGDTIETVFRTMISVYELSIYGAVSDLCEEYKACHVRTGRPVLAGQSDPFVKSTISAKLAQGDLLWQRNPTPFFASADLLTMTPTSSVEIPAQENLLQKHKEPFTTRSIDIVLY